MGPPAGLPSQLPAELPVTSLGCQTGRGAGCGTCSAAVLTLHPAPPPPLPPSFLAARAPSSQRSWCSARCCGRRTTWPWPTWPTPARTRRCLPACTTSQVSCACPVCTGAWWEAAARIHLGRSLARGVRSWRHRRPPLSGCSCMAASIAPALRLKPWPPCAGVLHVRPQWCSTAATRLRCSASAPSRGPCRPACSCPTRSRHGTAARRWLGRRWPPSQSAPWTRCCRRVLGEGSCACGFVLQQLQLTARSCVLVTSGMQAPGGLLNHLPLWLLVQVCSTLDTSAAVYVCGCMVLALEHLHYLGAQAARGLAAPHGLRLGGPARQGGGCSGAGCCLPCQRTHAALPPS